MQCTNCQFENMPGVTACGRCGASLRLAAAVVDVYPPRAGRLTKWWRRQSRVAYWSWRLRQRFAAMFLRPFRQFALERPSGAVVLRMVVPGWPQIYCGEPARGRILLGTFLGLFTSGLLLAGTFLGSILLGLALAVHATSVVDVVFSGTRDLLSRIVYCTACLAAVAAVSYLPAGWLVTRVAIPVRIGMNAAPFRAGDVVFYNQSAYRWSEPAAGDVVLYQVWPRTIRTHDGGHPVNYRMGGERIDRILAGPGQTVTWKNKRLLIDGQPSQWLPLAPDRMPATLSVKVPAGHYLIFPSTEPSPARRPVGMLEMPAAVLQATSVVSRSQILGRVSMRTQPLWRFWWIR